MLTAKELEQGAADGSIDTVVVPFTDMQGRLMGKRLHVNYFLDGDISEHGVEGLQLPARPRDGGSDKAVTCYERERMFERG